MTTNSAFGFEVPEDSPGFLLWQTTVLWQRRIKADLEPYGISHAQFVIMASLLWCDEHDQNSNQVTLAHHCKLDKMTISQALKVLSAQGYVYRKESPQDSRAKWVYLTAQGKKLAQQLVPVVEAIDHKFFSPLSFDDQKSLIRLLNQITQE